MGYHVLDPDELASAPDHPSERRSIADAVGLSTLAAAVYDVAPGEQLPRTYHYHEQREELFAVLDGTLTVRTPEETVTVDAGEVFVAEAGQPHLAVVPDGASEPARVLGVGAPQYDPARPYDPGSDGDPEGTLATGEPPDDGD